MIEKYNTLFIIWLLGNTMMYSQQLTIKPAMHSLGYQITLPPGYDPDSTAFTVVRYRAIGGNWEHGFPASRIEKSDFRGSLFQLMPGTTYELEIIIRDTIPVFKQNMLTATATTIAIPDVKPTGIVRWVSPDGFGNAYTETQPGNLQTLLNGGLVCGTTVLLKSGNYPISDINLHFSQHCPDTAPITLMAAPGHQPVLDGGYYTPHTWQPHPNDPNIWMTTLPPQLEFNALCVVDGERLYPYAFLSTPAFDPSVPALQTLGYGLSGFYRNKNNQFFIKTSTPKNINQSQVIFSKSFTCLTIYGNNFNLNLRIKDIHFRNYGKGRCDKLLGHPSTCYPSTTLRFINANRVIVDNCTFEFCNFPVNFEGNCNHNIVMNCQINDGTGYWSHAAFKRSADAYNILFDPDGGSHGRYLENVGIHFRPNANQPAEGNIVWKNKIQGVVDGILLGFINNSFMTDSDIGENQILWCFDGIGVIGDHRNARIWGNQVGYCPVGTSLISNDQKPVYIFRNVFHHLDQRQNHQNDVNFRNCNNTPTQQSWATALKLNAGGTAVANDLIFFFHNTVHSTEQYAFNLYLWGAEWKVLQLRNNIFYAEGESNFFFEGIQNQGKYSFESRNDNIINPTQHLYGIVRPQIGASCIPSNHIQQLGNILSNVTGSPFVFFENPLNLPPHFVAPTNNDFRLLPESHLIDKGIQIHGFNNSFSGDGPDIGALEHQNVSLATQTTTATEGLIIYPNPAKDQIFLNFSSPGGLAELELWNSAGMKVGSYRYPNLPTGNQVLPLEINTLSPGLYFLRMRFGDGLKNGRVFVHL